MPSIRLDAAVERFVRQVAQVGSTQHWIMAYGDLLVELVAWCELCRCRIAAPKFHRRLESRPT